MCLDSKNSGFQFNIFKIISFVFTFKTITFQKSIQKLYPIRSNSSNFVTKSNQLN